MSRNTASFKDRFEAALDAMAENGTFDAQAERLIAEHFSSGSKKPYGIEAARQVVISNLMDAFLDTGWALFDYDSTGLKQIQRDDEADIFDSDAEALAYVKERVEAGSERHAVALAEHLRDAHRIAERRAGSP